MKLFEAECTAIKVSDDGKKMLMEILHTIQTVIVGLYRNLFWLNLILAVVIVFFERRDPKTVWAWLLVLLFIPVIGFLLYLVIGQDMRKSRMFKTKEIEDAVHATIRKQEESITRKEFVPKDPDLKRYSDLIMYNLEAARAIYTEDNDVEIFTDGRELFGELYDRIKAAKSYIHLQSYIIKNDELWKPIEQLLIEKVKQGVEVRILYDSMGCRFVKRRDWKRMEEAGIILGEFFPAFLKRLHLRVNYRNHRKIIVIDGVYAYVGGFNFGREYIDLDKKKFGHWRDTHLRITGSAVLSLHIRFILDWNYATKDNLFLEERFFQNIPERGNGDKAIQIISSGPDSLTEEIRDNYLKLISKARKYIYIQSPYFVPDEPVLNAIRMAALSGIDVRLMIPCKPDHPFVYWATYSYIGELVNSGVKCYTYDNGFLHAKGITTDGLVSCYGTANMDIRSFQLNFEVNATIYSQEIAEKMEEIFTEDLKYCTQITPYIYKNRNMIIRVKEQFSRMFSPLL